MDLNVEKARWALILQLCLGAQSFAVQGGRGLKPLVTVQGAPVIEGRIRWNVS